MTNVKYKYATNDKEEVIDISNLTDADRHDYECISCRNVLRPVLPVNRRKHFRHKTTVNCSEETYLHRMGKLLFRDIYKKCVDDSKPFLIEYFSPTICNHCVEHGPCSLQPTISKYDLTRTFREIKLETRDGNFIPDLLLVSLNGQKLYVEIAVTHASSEEKLNSGNKIIEIQITTEEDLEIIKSMDLSVNDKRVSCINFNPKETIGNFSASCPKRISFFMLWESGKSILTTKKPFEYAELKKNKKVFLKDAPFTHPDIYVQYLEEAFLEKRMVRNCFLCRYHAIAKYYQREYEDTPIFCKYLKKSCNSNFAAECKSYVADKKVFRFCKAS